MGVVSTIAAGQLEREVKAATLRQVVTGRVCMPDGSPVSGAVVVSSAGGECVTGADGSFALAVGLPLDAERLEVTAVADEPAGSGSLVANVSFVPSALSATTILGTMVVSPSLTCLSRWLPTFGGMLGDDYAEAFAIFDDGGGQALYVGGSFRNAGVAVNGIARWDGAAWAALGGGVGSPGEGVFALAVFDEGSGEALYAGGSFTTAGGSPAKRIAKWDGSSWSALGSGLNDWVDALAVYDDGSGPALYAGGRFTTAGGVVASLIAKWDGSSWMAVGGGLGTNSVGVPPDVLALAVYDDGSGPALYAGGRFTTTGGGALTRTVNRIASWNGTSWSALGSGMNNLVSALTVYDDGSGPALYAGGQFTTAGGVIANRIAKWNGTSWSPLGSGANDSVTALAVYDDGSGRALYVGGFFASAGGVVAKQIARWDGTSWSAFGGTGKNGIVALAVYDDGGGPALYTGGLAPLDGEGVFGANSVRKWDGSNWSGLGGGVDGTLNVLAVHDDGSGSALYAGGSLETAGNLSVNGISKWDGASWSALGSGFDLAVRALTTYDDGSGSALYAGGDFTTAGGVAASRIAKWDGTSWSPLGSGVGTSAVPPFVSALTVFDDGSGPALYAGGTFTSVGGMAASRIAKWDGTTWSALSSGMNSTVYALTVHDDGSGPALYAGGSFTSAGSVAANRIAKWDGTNWSVLGVGANDRVRCMTTYDDGSGPALYAGGDFTNAGGVAARKIAKWDGTSWSAVGAGLRNTVSALAVHDDGLGPKLYAGGLIGKRVARWDGSRWTSLGHGFTATQSVSSSFVLVRTLASWDDGDGSALYSGGAFINSPAGDTFLAKWGCRQKVRKGRF